MAKGFNPFYDSEFLISREGSDDRRMLVEMYPDELARLRDEIDVVLEKQNNKETNHLAVVLDTEKHLSGGGPDTMFYRYFIGDFELRFTQDMKNGNLLNVKLEEQGNELEDFKISVKDTQLQFGVFYPTRFEVEPLNYPRRVEEVKEHLEKWQKAMKVLSAVEEFFATSKHFELFSKHHSIDRSVDDILCSAKMRVCDEDVSERKDRSLDERGI